jgi:hypothetical protein
MEKVEFEFPDEAAENPRKGGAVVRADDEPEIEIIDDAPPEDRGRKPMEEPPKEVTDEELSKYDESVQKRIKHFTKGYHEERRAKEAAQREKEEALRMAQAIADENRTLKGSLHQGQSALLEQAKRVVTHEVEAAERKFKEAYEAGDSDAMVTAQRELNAASLKADKVNNFKPPPLQDQKFDVQPQQRQQQAPAVDPKLSDWQDQNPWFGPNRKLTAYALGLHGDLVDEGITVGSDAYYQRIDTDMRERFPDQFESGKSADAPTQRQKSNVVAPATRSTAPKKIVLTKSQVEIAKRLGVPLELYARKVAEEMRKI